MIFRLNAATIRLFPRPAFAEGGGRGGGREEENRREKKKSLERSNEEREREGGIAEEEEEVVVEDRFDRSKYRERRGEERRGCIVLRWIVAIDVDDAQTRVQRDSRPRT